MSDLSIIEIIESWLEENKFSMSLEDKSDRFLSYSMDNYGSGVEYWFFVLHYDSIVKCLFGCTRLEEDDYDTLFMKVSDPKLFDKLMTFILPSYEH